MNSLAVASVIATSKFCTSDVLTPAPTITIAGTATAIAHSGPQRATATATNGESISGVSNATRDGGNSGQK